MAGFFAFPSGFGRRCCSEHFVKAAANQLDDLWPLCSLPILRVPGVRLFDVRIFEAGVLGDQSEHLLIITPLLLNDLLNPASRTGR